MPSVATRLVVVFQVLAVDLSAMTVMPGLGVGPAALLGLGAPRLVGLTSFVGRAFPYEA